jgi:hypothetical protein
MKLKEIRCTYRDLQNVIVLFKQPNIKAPVLRFSQLELNVWLQLSGLDRGQYGGFPDVSAHFAVAIFMVKDCWRNFDNFYIDFVFSQCVRGEP